MTAKTVRLLWPESTSTRRLPRNLRDEDLPLFQNELERVIPATSLLEFDNLRISPDGVLFNALGMLPESFAFPHNIKQWKLRSRIKFFVDNYGFRHRRNVEHEVLWVTDDWSSAYFHWLMDVMSRLVVMGDRLSQLGLLLPHTYEKSEFVHSSLRCFNLKSIEFIGPSEVLRVRRVVMPSHVAPTGHYNDDIIRQVRELMVRTLGGQANYKGKGQCIYISRARASKRRIANEAEVVEVLQRLGFLTVYPEEMSLEEQVKLFSRTRYLVSNHGAGLANMLFVPEGANVLELRLKGDSHRNFYFSLASALNQNYFYQTCPPAAHDVDAHVADLIVDTVALKENVGRLLTME